MALFSFTIETKLSPGEVIDLVHNVSKNSNLTIAERRMIVYAFPASHWPTPNPLSANADYDFLVKSSKWNRSIYLGLIVPTENDSGTKIVFGVDRILMPIVAIPLILIILLSILDIPNVSNSLALPIVFLCILIFCVILIFTVNRFKNMINKIIN